MDTLLKADIFFVIASVATIVVAILVAIVLCYLIKAGKNLYMISEALQEKFRDSEEFFTELKDRLEDSVVFKFFFPLSRRRTRKKKWGM